MAGPSAAGPGMSLEEANNIWQCIKHKVVTKMCGSGWTPTPHLQDAHMFHPLSVIGKRMERSLRLRKVRSLFPLGPLSELIDRPDDPDPDPEHLRPLGTVTREGPVRCDLLHEEFLDGVGRVRIQVLDYFTESGIQPMAPHTQLTLKENLPWLDSVHRLYLVSQTVCSSSCRVRLLGGEPGSHQLKLGPETPLGFTCLRLSALPSGLVEVKRGWETGYLHPKARWACYSSPEYERLTGGTATEPRVMSMLSQLAFSFAHPSTMSLPGPISTSHETLSQEPELPEDNPEEALLPMDDEEDND